MYREIKFIIHWYQDPTNTTRPVPRPATLSDDKKNSYGRTPRSAASMISPALLLVMLTMKCVRSCRLPRCQTDETPSFVVLLQTTHVYPTPVSCQRYFYSSGLHVDTLPGDVAPPNNPSGKVYTAGDNAASCQCADMFFLVSDYPRIFISIDLLLQLLLLLLLLSRSAHGRAVPLKIPHPLRTTTSPAIILLSRGFRCCSASYLRYCVQLHLQHRRVPTMVF